MMRSNNFRFCADQSVIVILLTSLLLCTCALPLSMAFAPKQRIFLHPRHHRSCPSSRQYAVRYGPPPSQGGPGGIPAADDDHDDNNRRSTGLTREALFTQQKQEFRDLLFKILAVQDPQHIPSLLTRNIDLILSLSGNNGVAVVDSILREARNQENNNVAEANANDETLASRLEQAIDLTLSFAEDFVNSAFSLDDQNKKLLGKIIRAMSDKDLPTARQREEALDALLATERENLTAGFLRHLEGECQKIAQSPVMNPDSARTLEMMRVIQTRVLEEVGQTMGEAAQVLGQLIGYENDAERLAVLEAGLVIRGVEFAEELRELTTEALDGLQHVPGGAADPQLVRIVQGIDQALQRHIEQEKSFQ